VSYGEDVEGRREQEETQAELWGEPINRRGLLRRLGALEQLAGIRLVTMGDGRERGVRVLEVRTGRLAFDILIDRSFDVWRCDLGGMPVAWLSPSGAVGPWHGEQDTDWGWLRTFQGGLLATCGLDHTGGPGEDAADRVFAIESTTEHFGLHGRVGGIPARLVGYGERWDGDRCTFWAEGEVRQTYFYGERLVLRRRIEADLGGTSIRVHDEVENIAFEPVTHMQLYHVNIGWPIVNEGSELLIAATEVRDIHDDAPGDYRRLPAPLPGVTERVFEHEVAAGADGVVTVAVVNRRLGLGFAERFQRAQLPRQNTWWMMAEGFYALGLEPATNRDSGRWEARKRGELLSLGPGEIRRYDLELEVLAHPSAIERAEAEVARALESVDL
jgi:hypothetical protein